MKHLRQCAKAAALLTAWSAFFFPGVAYAYVDPGSGSVIVTAVLGALGALGYTFRKYFYRLKKAVFRKEPGPNE